MPGRHLSAAKLQLKRLCMLPYRAVARLLIIIRSRLELILLGGAVFVLAGLVFHDGITREDVGQIEYISELHAFGSYFWEALGLPGVEPYQNAQYQVVLTAKSLHLKVRLGGTFSLATSLTEETLSKWKLPVACGQFLDYDSGVHTSYPHNSPSLLGRELGADSFSDMEFRSNLGESGHLTGDVSFMTIVIAAPSRSRVYRNPSTGEQLKILPDYTLFGELLGLTRNQWVRLVIDGATLDQGGWFDYGFFGERPTILLGRPPQYETRLCEIAGIRLQSTHADDDLNDSMGIKSPGLTIKIAEGRSLRLSTGVSIVDETGNSGTLRYKMQAHEVTPGNTVTIGFEPPNNMGTLSIDTSRNTSPVRIIGKATVLLIDGQNAMPLLIENWPWYQHSLVWLGLSMVISRLSLKLQHFLQGRQKHKEINKSSEEV